jgi:hypothetical protein
MLGNAGTHHSTKIGGPGLPRGRRGWLNGSGGGGEREPLAFGESKGEVEKGWVDDKVERLRTHFEV